MPRHRAWLRDDRFESADGARRAEERGALHRRFETVNAASVRGLANAAEQITAESDGRESRGNGRRLAAAAAAGPALVAFRMRRSPKSGVLGFVHQHDLRHVRLADDHRPGATQTFNDRPFGRGEQRPTPSDAERRRRADQVEAIFDGHRHAGQRTERFAALARLIDGPGRRAGLIGERRDDRVQMRIDRRLTSEKGF